MEGSTVQYNARQYDRKYQNALHVLRVHFIFLVVCVCTYGVSHVKPISNYLVY